MKEREPRWPRLMRVLALSLFIAVSAALVLSYRQHHNPLLSRRGEGENVGWSARLLSVSENVRHLQTRGGRPLFLLTAGRDELYDDGHHELNDVSAILYTEDGAERARITARRAVYYQRSGLVIFARDVQAQTREGVRLRTEELQYDQAADLLRTERPVTFEQESVEAAASNRWSGWGESLGAEIHLRRDQETLTLLRAVRLTVISGAARPHARWTIHAERARFERTDRRFYFLGDVRLHRDADAREELRADRLEGRLDQEHRVRQIQAFGNVRLRSGAEGMEWELAAGDLVLDFAENQSLSRARAVGDVLARFRDAREQHELQSPRLEIVLESEDRRFLHVPYRVRAEGPRVHFRTQVVPEESREAPRANRNPDSGERRLEADAMDAVFRKGTRQWEQVRARGDVRLEILPPSGARGRERVTIRAHQARLEFDTVSNRARTCWAEGDVSVEVASRETPPAHPKRVTQSLSLLAQFDPQTQEIVSLLQSGQFRYVEGERRAQSERAIYEGESGWIRLRGGDPTVWDTRGRTRADELDLNPRQERSVARGRVLTTLLGRAEAARALPFAKEDAPVFIAADHLEVDHRARWARYRGRVRAWQHDSYLMADQMEIREAERLLRAQGDVRSLLFSGHRPETPLFISASELTYREVDRTVIGTGGASWQQGAQRLTADRLVVWLGSERADIERARAEGRVTFVDAERRAFAEQAFYEARPEKLVLEGSPARVQDDRQRLEQQGTRLTFLGGGDKVLVEGDDGTRRVKTVRKIRRGEP